MLKNNRIILPGFFVVLLSLFMLVGQLNNCLAQDNKNYYWFYVMVKKDKNKVTNTDLIKISGVGDSIKSGTFSKFVSEHSANLQKEKIIVGPFENYENSKISKHIYQNAGEHNIKVDNEKDYYMFFVKPFKDGETNTIHFENIPARVTLCSQYLFSDIMSEGFNFDKLAIGPFPKYELAEKAKYTFLRNDIPSEPSKKNNEQNNKLSTMLKKWEKLKIHIVSQNNKHVKEKTFYRFSTRFRKKYFDPDVVQVLLIYPVCKNIARNEINGISLQGSNIKDNNRVIPFSKKTNYSEVLYFNLPKGIEVEGFKVESFIYNQSSLIKLPQRYIKLKSLL